MSNRWAKAEAAVQSPHFKQSTIPENINPGIN
jgi:hypothetical protein